MRVMLDECVPRPFGRELVGLAFGVIVMRAQSNRLDDLLPLVTGVLAALGDLKAGDLRHVP